MKKNWEGVKLKLEIPFNSFKELKEYASSETDNEKYFLNRMLCGILELIKEKDILTVYAKNLFKNYKELEIFTLTNRHKIILSKLIYNENKIEMFTYDVDNIELIELILPIKEERIQAELKIVFNNGKQVYLNSDTDTNLHWKERYSNYIKEIAKLLIHKEHL